MARKGRVRTRRQRAARSVARTKVLRLPGVPQLPQTAIRRSTVRLSRAEMLLPKAVKLMASTARQRDKRVKPAFVDTLTFKEVRHAQVCAKRKARKEVIHALGVAGNIGIKRRRVSLDSTIQC